MITVLFDLIALIIFWRFADFTRIKQLFPVAMTGVFIRFLQHYIMIDWLHIWEVHGPKWKQLWLPLSANIMIWSVVCYLFIQFLPKRRKILYGIMWVFIMLAYLKILTWAHVFTMQKGWTIGRSFIALCFYFIMIYVVWRWLSYKPQKDTAHK